jgi:D-tyrosyl-tRNA(Tyr) deacylase
VAVDGEVIGQIDQGLLALVGVQKHDNQASADKLLKRMLSYRVFVDAEDKMNLSLSDIGGDLLLVSQFTLTADTQKGARPSFSSAASPDLGHELFEYVVNQARAQHPVVETGRFGADMQVSLLNDGPVTFWLET